MTMLPEILKQHVYYLRAFSINGTGSFSRFENLDPIDGTSCWVTRRLGDGAKTEVGSRYGYELWGFGRPKIGNIPARNGTDRARCPYGISGYETEDFRRHFGAFNGSISPKGLSEAAAY